MQCIKSSRYGPTALGNVHIHHQNGGGGCSVFLTGMVVGGISITSYILGLSCKTVSAVYSE